MVATAHWCLHNLVAVGVYKSREVGVLYQSVCCRLCSLSSVLLVSVQLSIATYLDGKKLFLLGLADELCYGMVGRVMYLCGERRR